MKNYFLLFFFSSMGWSGLFTTAFVPEKPLTFASEDCGISFDYDIAGNRIKRFLCLGVIELEFRTGKSNDSQLISTLDLEKSLEGHSATLESEIEQLEALLRQPTNLDLTADDEETIELDKQNFSDLSDMIVFPNPTMSTFSIQGEGLHPEATVSIISMDGRILSQRTLADGRDISVYSLPVGAYLVTVVHKNDRRISMLVKSEKP
ncbi:MAG: T9SS type A sorting domain-containing protein [Bacteroidota bacterium]